MVDKKKEAEKKKRYEVERSLEEGLREKKILSSLLKLIDDLNKQMIDINSKRGQYHKG